LPLVEQFRGLGLPLPPGLGDETRLSLAHVLAYCAGRFAEGAPGALTEMRSTLSRGRAAGLEPLPALLEGPWERGLSRLLDGLEVDFSASRLEDLREAALLAVDAGVHEWRAAAQTRFFRLWKTRGDSSAAARDAAAALGITVG
jgi:hypothetical protein